MKKLLLLFLIFALFANVFSETCEECEENCKKVYSGFLNSGKRKECILDCILNC